MIPADLIWQCCSIMHRLCRADLQTQVQVNFLVLVRNLSIHQFLAASKDSMF